MSTTIAGLDGKLRCSWCAGAPEFLPYHDTEWGFPVSDDQRLFEKLCLEGFQSGLSWRTILNKRDNFRAAFHGFDFNRVARFTQRDVNRLWKDAGIVRHRGKILSAVNNARRARAVVKEFGSLARYFWGFEPDSSSRPKRLTWELLRTMPHSPESHALSRDLKRRGFTFVGPTIVYAFLPAMGLSAIRRGLSVRAQVARRKAFTQPTK
jgi:DNA-3-methyladenine glycosylase I